MRFGIRVVQRLPADGAETRAVLSAERLIRKRENEGVIRPAADVEIAVGDVWAPQLVVVRQRLIDLAAVDLELAGGRLQAADARPTELGVEAQPEGVAGARSGDVDRGVDLAARRRIALAGKHDRLKPELQLERAGLP